MLPEALSDQVYLLRIRGNNEYCGKIIICTELLKAVKC